MTTQKGEMKRTFCQICKCNCGIIAEVKNGRILRIEGDRENPNSRGKLCVKGMNSLEILYHSERLKKPLLNTGERGDPQWEEIPWDLALGIMKSKLEALKAKYGPESTVFLLGTTSRILDTSLVRRFANLYGTPNVTETWSICVGPKVLGYLATFGHPRYPICEFSHSRFIVLWGTNPLVSYMHRYHAVVEDILRAKMENGAPIVVIDPRKSETATIANYHLPIKPNTDFYLAMGMVQYLIDNDLYDHDFVTRYTTGFDELRASLGGYDLEAVAKKTDLPIRLIREVTERLAQSKPASIDRREGILHTVNGLQTARAIAILMALTGNVDIQGGLVFNPPIRLNDITLKEKLPEVKKAFWAERYPLALDCSGYLVEAILSEQPYPIKSLVALEVNPLLTLPNTKKVIEAMKKLEFVAVHDPFLTETCRFADLVLPATTFYEKAEIDIGLLKRTRWLRTRRRVIEPLYDSKSETELMMELGDKMGYRNSFNFSSEDDILRSLLKGSEGEPYALEELEKGVCLEQMKPGYLRDRGFNTPSGKIELLPSILRPFGASIPKPIQGPAESGDYPFLLVTGAKVPSYYHSQFRNVESLTKLCPSPFAEVGAGIAQKAGVSEGDIIRISTPAGALEITARIREEMHPFTVSIPHGWTDHNANILIDDLFVEPLSGAPMYRGIPCQVTKGPLRGSA